MFNGKEMEENIVSLQLEYNKKLTVNRSLYVSQYISAFKKFNKNTPFDNITLNVFIKDNIININYMSNNKDNELKIKKIIELSNMAIQDFFSKYTENELTNKLNQIKKKTQQSITDEIVKIFTQTYLSIELEKELPIIRKNNIVKKI